MSAEDNKAVVRRFYEEVFNGRNLGTIDDLQTADLFDHTFGTRGVEATKQFFMMLFQVFPDLRVEVRDVIAEGDLVAARVSYSGTYQGRFLGIPATGRQAEHW